MFALNQIRIMDANQDCLDSSYFNAIDEEDEKVSGRISVQNSLVGNDKFTDKSESDFLAIATPESLTGRPGNVHKRKNAIVHSREGTDSKSVESRKVNNFLLQNAFQTVDSDTDKPQKHIICDFDEEQPAGESIQVSADLHPGRESNHDLQGTTLINHRDTTRQNSSQSSGYENFVNNTIDDANPATQRKCFDDYDEELDDSMTPIENDTREVNWRITKTSNMQAHALKLKQVKEIHFGVETAKNTDLEQNEAR